MKEWLYLPEGGQRNSEKLGKIRPLVTILIPTSLIHASIKADTHLTMGHSAHSQQGRKKSGKYGFLIAEAMGIRKVNLVMAGMAMWFITSNLADADQGLAVYYGPKYIPSACYKDADMGKMIAGVNGKLWQNGNACGRKYRVTCTGPANEFEKACKDGSVVVTVVDLCSEPCNGDLNLYQDAFNIIADLQAGKVKIDYQGV